MIPNRISNISKQNSSSHHNITAIDDSVISNFSGGGAVGSEPALMRFNSGGAAPNGTVSNGGSRYMGVHRGSTEVMMLNGISQGINSGHFGM